jgi:hypothetical protein
MHSICRWLTSWSVVSMVVGVVLLAAAALKGYEVATEELLEEGLLTSRWFLMLVVEWEVLFALWLLGGFYRFYPRATRTVAVLYFLVLFEVSLASVAEGRPSCACFGKALVSPWVTGLFNLVVLLLVVAAPMPDAAEHPRGKFPWLVLGGVASVFGLVSLITMWNHSTQEATPTMRADPQLGRAVTIQRFHPTTEDLLEFCGKAAGVQMTADQRVHERQPQYGVVDVKDARLWAVMEHLARQQVVPVRWEKAEGEYRMVPAAPFGKRLRFWFNAVALLLIAMMALRGFEAPAGVTAAVAEGGRTWAACSLGQDVMGQREQSVDVRR